MIEDVEIVEEIESPALNVTDHDDAGDFGDEPADEHAEASESGEGLSTRRASVARESGPAAPVVGVGAVDVDVPIAVASANRTAGQIARRIGPFGWRSPRAERRPAPPRTASATRTGPRVGHSLLRRAAADRRRSVRRRHRRDRSGWPSSHQPIPSGQDPWDSELERDSDSDSDIWGTVEADSDSESSDTEDSDSRDRSEFKDAGDRQSSGSLHAG